MLKTANYLLKQHCCNSGSCSDLVDDLQEMQFKCNDAFKNEGRNSLDIDKKGNIEGTVCSQLRDKKNRILSQFNNSKLGGNKNLKKGTRKFKKTQKNKRSKQNRKLTKNKTNTRKTR